MTAIDPGKFVISAAQFEAVENSGSGLIDLQKVISGFIPVAYDDDFHYLNTAPQIQIQDGKGGYTLYYYLLDALDEKNDKLVEGWADSAGGYAGDLLLSAGTAFWIKTASEGTTESVVSGAVCGEDAVTIEVPQDTFRLIANAFPMALDLNSASFDSSDVTTVEYDDDMNFLKTAAQIQIQDGKGGYSLYYYLSDGLLIDKVTKEESYVRGWCDSAGTIVDVKIPVGKGFWIKSVPAACKLTFNK